MRTRVSSPRVTTRGQHEKMHINDGTSDIAFNTNTGTRERTRTRKGRSNRRQFATYRRRLEASRTDEEASKPIGIGDHESRLEIDEVLSEAVQANPLICKVMAGALCQGTCGRLIPHHEIRNPVRDVNSRNRCFRCLARKYIWCMEKEWKDYPSRNLLNPDQQ